MKRENVIRGGIPMAQFGVFNYNAMIG